MKVRPLNDVRRSSANGELTELHSTKEYVVYARDDGGKSPKYWLMPERGSSFSYEFNIYDSKLFAVTDDSEDGWIEFPYKRRNFVMRILNGSPFGEGLRGTPSFIEWFGWPRGEQELFYEGEFVSMANYFELFPELEPEFSSRYASIDELVGRAAITNINSIELLEFIEQRGYQLVFKQMDNFYSYVEAEFELSDGIQVGLGFDFLGELIYVNVMQTSFENLARIDGYTSADFIRLAKELVTGEYTIVSKSRRRSTLETASGFKSFIRRK
ncbi:hypothetical protein JOD55_000204 [Arcanobacterium pluranimalium]|uniref:hypothetical protein n=1 Tax=Arcanobacterium pluranimalium TaxID=108028 RepID=UPI0019587F8A|nr:hypothetical protein [Arcanobacterium pluranimalium]MBM7824377.1 hypothetical protein [Arcanobacterium pluranimalium]